MIYVCIENGGLLKRVCSVSGACVVVLSVCSYVCVCLVVVIVSVCQMSSHAGLKEFTSCAPLTRVCIGMFPLNVNVYKCQ